jgi:Mn2+/Fe2+ NRAMP family transporter
MLGNIKVSQVLAILLVVVAIVLLVVFTSKVKRMGVEYVFYKDTEDSKKLLAELTAPKSKKSKEENTNKTEDS